MFQFSQVLLKGFIGGDPRVTEFQSEKEETIQIISFNVAINKSYLKNEERIEKTQWHSVVVKHQGLAKLAAKLKKGDSVLVQGELENREYETKEKEKRTVTEIVVAGNHARLIPISPREDQ